MTAYDLHSILIPELREPGGWELILKILGGIALGQCLEHAARKELPQEILTRNLSLHLAEVTNFVQRTLPPNLPQGVP